jgi:hypothetical protein
MGLATGQKALMYALGGIARGGATRGGYTSVKPFIAVGGEQVATAGPDPNKNVLVESLTISDNLEQAPNTCAFVTRGFVPALGAPVVITLGTINSLTRLFGGVVLKAEQVYLADAPANVAYRVDAIDFTWLINRRLVNARYVNQSGTAIALDLMAKNTQGFTTFGVQQGLAVLDEISFTNQSMTDALGQLAKRLGATFYVDYGGRTVTTYGDLHFFVGAESQVVPPLALTPTHPTMRNLSRLRDLSQIVTRMFYEGGGANAEAPCVPGETIIPVETIAWYNPAGGMVTSGPQRLAYARIAAGGGGTLVGPGATPSAAPQANIGMGAGVTAGAHDYAVTFVTASGESLPGPRIAVNVSGLLAGPTTPPAAAVKAGGAGPDAGVHYYGVSFLTAAGETQPGPVSFPYTQATIAAPFKQIIVVDVADNTGYGELHPGDLMALYYTYSTNPDTSAVPPLNGLNEAGFSPASDGYTIKTGFGGYGKGFGYYIPCSPDPNVKTIHVWVSFNFLAMKLLITGSYGFANNPGASSAYYQFISGDLTTIPQQSGFIPIVGGVNLSAIPLGPAGVTGRKIWRTTAGGTVLKFLGTLADNTSTTASDLSLDSALGANAPAVGTAQAAQVALSGIPIGGSTVTGRKVYRTAAGVSQLQLLTTLADNITTAFLDALADASLGANAPTGDTSALKQPDGQVLAGSPTLIVAGAAAFRITGGWALLPGGQQVRYTSIVGNALSGIPPTGPGAITATINYNATVTAAPALEGVPAAGPGAIVVQIKIGDPVNLLVQEDDTAAQAALATIIGGDGIQEAYGSDNRISEAEAHARAKAALSLRNTVEETLRYESRDRLTQTGSMIAVNLPLPTNMVGTYKIQQVTISQFQFAPTPPLRTIEASSNRFSFEDLLRLARLVTPPGA